MPKSIASQPKTRRRTAPKALTNPYNLTWPANTELLGLRFTLRPLQDSTLPAQYTTGLHGWFFHQVQAIDPQLSQLLHDETDEKAFTLSGLDGQFQAVNQHLNLKAKSVYHWTLTAFSKPMVQWLAKWLTQLPEVIEIYHVPLQVETVAIALPPTTYAKILPADASLPKSLKLSFLSPTSFRQRGNHFPLPVPRNLFQSYLRRWNDFSGQPIEIDPFLDWLDTAIVIQGVNVWTQKIAIKKGAVTGFKGAIDFGVTPRAQVSPEFFKMLHRLVQFAPYCGTGHKTTFGLGQTVLGWHLPTSKEVPLEAGAVLADRIAELTEIFLAQRKRQGGSRASDTAQVWATILARREAGESLMAIAEDLGMKHATVQRYVKLARKQLSSCG